MTFPRPISDHRARRAKEREANLRQLASPSRALVRGSYSGTVAKTAAPIPVKIERKANQAIRDSARGEACTVRIPGVCTHDPEKTIWSHSKWLAAGKGKSTKAVDLAGAYACTSCDAVYDGQVKPPTGYTREQVDADWCMGHFRSLVRLAEKGLI